MVSVSDPLVATGNIAGNLVSLDVDLAPVLVARIPDVVRVDLAAVALAAATNASRRTLRTRLDWIAHVLGFRDCSQVPWHALEPIHTAWIAARAIDRCAPDTARAIHAALRALVLQGWRLGVYTHDTHARLISLPRVTGTRRSRGRVLSALEIEKLRAAAGDGARGDRDRAAIALLVGGGLRRAEACGVDVAQLDAGGTSVRVIGKGDRERLVPLPAWARFELQPWLARRGDGAGPFLNAVGKAGAIAPGQMTGTGLYLALARLTDRAGVDLWSPHDGRKTFATTMLEHADLATVAELLGHVSTDTTRLYDLRGDYSRAAAVARMDRWISPQK